MFKCKILSGIYVQRDAFQLNDRWRRKSTEISTEIFQNLKFGQKSNSHTTLHIGRRSAHSHRTAEWVGKVHTLLYIITIIMPHFSSIPQKPQIANLVKKSFPLPVADLVQIVIIAPFLIWTREVKLISPLCPDQKVPTQNFPKNVGCSHRIGKILIHQGSFQN